MSKKLFFTCLVAFGLILTSCGGQGSSEQPSSNSKAITPVSIAISGTSTVKVNETVQLSAVVSPTGVSQQVTWSSLDEAKPIVAHLAYYFPREKATYGIEDQFMLGDALLSVPVTEDYIYKRKFYLPSGTWYRMGSTEAHEGGRYMELLIDDESFILFLRKNKAVSVNLDKTMTFGKGMSNQVHRYKKLTFIYSGVGNYHFQDEHGHQVSFAFGEGKVSQIVNPSNLDITFIDYEKEGASLWPKNLLKD